MEGLCFNSTCLVCNGTGVCVFRCSCTVPVCVYRHACAHTGTVPDVYFFIAEAKDESGDVAGALESARECVRIYDKHGITDEYSRYAGDMVMRLEGIE